MYWCTQYDQAHCSCGHFPTAHRIPDSNVITWFHCVSILRASSDQFSYLGFCSPALGTLFYLKQQSSLLYYVVHSKAGQNDRSRIVFLAPPPLVFFWSIVNSSSVPRSEQVKILKPACQPTIRPDKGPGKRAEKAPQNRETRASCWWPL